MSKISRVIFIFHWCSQQRSQDWIPDGTSTKYMALMKIYQLWCPNQHWHSYYSIQNPIPTATNRILPLLLRRSVRYPKNNMLSITWSRSLNSIMRAEQQLSFTHSPIQQLLPILQLLKVFLQKVSIESIPLIISTYVQYHCQYQYQNPLRIFLGPPSFLSFIYYGRNVF